MTAPLPENGSSPKPVKVQRSSSISPWCRSKETGAGLRGVTCQARGTEAETMPAKRLAVRTIGIVALCQVVCKWFAGGLELEHNYRPYGDDFYNGGVFLHNLDQQRADNAAETLVKFLIYNKVPNLDEEALNKYAVPAGKAVPFPTRYNENMFNGYTNDPAIVHFVGIAEWWKEDKFRSEYWRKYMR